MKRRHRVTELVLSSGGTNGVAMLGALESLRLQGRLRRINRIVGTSIGAVIGLLLTIGYSPRTLFELVLRIDFAQFDDMDCDSVLMFYDTLGAVDGRSILRLIRIMMEKRGLAEGTTFAELPRAIEYVATGYSVSELRTVAFSAATHPTMPVLLAVRISISIPLLFRPVRFDNQVFVDGGWSEPTPVRFCRRRRRALIVSLSSGVYHSDAPKATYPMEMPEYLSRLILDVGKLLRTRCWTRMQRRFPDNLVVVQLRANTGKQMSFLDLEMSRETKLDLYSQGVAAATENGRRTSSG